MTVTATVRFSVSCSNPSCLRVSRCHEGAAKGFQPLKPLCVDPRINNSLVGSDSGKPFFAHYRYSWEAAVCLPISRLNAALSEWRVTRRMTASLISSWRLLLRPHFRCTRNVKPSRARRAPDFRHRLGSSGRSGRAANQPISAAKILNSDCKRWRGPGAVPPHDWPSLGSKERTKMRRLKGLSGRPASWSCWTKSPSPSERSHQGSRAILSGGKGSCDHTLPSLRLCPAAFHRRRRSCACWLPPRSQPVE